MDSSSFVPLKIPTSPFVQGDRTEPLYGSWDHRISPYAYIERVLGSYTESVDDKREYKGREVVEYLVASGAHLVEKSVNIDGDKAGGGGVDSGDDFIDGLLAGDLGMFQGRSYYLYWYKGCLVSLEGREGTLTIETYAPTGHPVESIHREFEAFLAPRKRAAVSVLLNSSEGMTTRSVDFEPPVIEDLEMNYGKGFAKVDKQIVGKLSENRAGLVCLHGSAGTGKTNYIKHLTSRINREFIFIPVGLAGELASPAFLNLLLEHERAILVLEDAEQALQSRETDHWNSSTVASLLNLSDGILGTLLNISIIATYNADKQTIDKALLRKGRLMFDYTFNPLSMEDAQRLAKHLGKDSSAITGPTSLADIYNAEDDTGYIAPKAKAMGFGASL